MQTMLPAEAHAMRVADYRRRLNQEARPYDGLYKGRRQARIAAEGILLNSGNQCLACDALRERLVTMTLGGPDGLLVGFHLCQPCSDEAGTFPSLLAYLSARFHVPIPYSVVSVSREEAYERGKRVLRDDLGCEIEKEVPSQLQATGRRPSGFRVIFRLEGPLNYGYTVFDPNWRQIGRFDSSNDHPELPYGPDHFHYDLPADNTKVWSSFLTGVPELDVLALRDFLKQVEP